MATAGSPSFDIRTLIQAQDFARHIDSLSEDSDFILVAEKAAVMGGRLRGGGFGNEMGLAVDSFEETGRQFAVAVTALRETAANLARTAVSVQGA